MTAVEGLTGDAKPKGILPREVGAAYAWMAALRADLAAPPTAADESVLASVGRLQLLELRLSRAVFGKGAIRKSGDIRPALSELRGIVRLKLDALSKLRFRDSKTRRVDLETYLRDRTQPIVPPADAEVVPAPDRDAAGQDANGAGQ